MKKFLALLLAAALMLTAGCGSVTYFEKEVTDEETVRIGLTEEPAVLDPALCNTPRDMTLVSHLFEGLTEKNKEGETVGAAAEDWEVTRTKNAAKRPVYTFTLREDACWSDGTPLKAEDFIYAWTRVIGGEVESPYAYLFDVILGADSYDKEKDKEKEGVPGLEATEDGKLVVTLEGDCAYFPELVSHPAFFPVREKEVSRNEKGWSLSPETLIGNGAYALTEWVRDDHMTLKANEAYRAADEIKGNTLDFVIRPEEELREAAAGGEIQAALAPIVGGRHIEIPDGSYHYYAINHATVTDENLRQALALSLDREAVLAAAGTETRPVSGRAQDRFFPGEPLVPTDL